jgi:predicted RNA-binding Zn ribbon-like protein
MAEKHYVIVDEIPLPASLAGHPVLHFCNTRAGWNGGIDGDYLQSYDHLAVWAGFAGLLAADRVTRLRERAQRHPAAGRAALQRARVARARIYDALQRPQDPEAVDPVAGDAAITMRHLRVSVVDGAPAWQVSDRAGLSAPTVAVLWSAALLLTSADRQLVRACPGEGCGWLFLDRSGRRRWCTMARCGNRAKARRFADRCRRPGAPDSPVNISP